MGYQKKTYSQLDETVAQIKALADKLKIPRSQVIRQAVEDYAKKIEGGEK